MAGFERVGEIALQDSLRDLMVATPLTPSLDTRVRPRVDYLNRKPVDQSSGWIYRRPSPLIDQEAASFEWISSVVIPIAHRVGHDKAVFATGYVRTGTNRTKKRAAPEDGSV